MRPWALPCCVWRSMSATSWRRLAYKPTFLFFLFLYSLPPLVPLSLSYWGTVGRLHLLCCSCCCCCVVVLYNLVLLLSALSPPNVMECSRNLYYYCAHVPISEHNTHPQHHARKKERKRDRKKRREKEKKKKRKRRKKRRKGGGVGKERITNHTCLSY